MFLILVNSIFLIISYISFSKAFKSSFCVDVDTVLNPKFLQWSLFLHWFKNGTWVKKGDDILVDVTMGSFDGAEICELVGLFLLDKPSKLIRRENVGLYIDHDRAAINSSSGHVLDKMRKNIISFYKNEGLSITIGTNPLEKDFLDVTFNWKVFPFRETQQPAA